jgi:methionine-rich copper-binding protein CopC
MRNTLILSLALSLAVAGAASAHARLITAAPKAGTTVAAPKDLKLTYSESIVAAGSSVSLADAKGGAVATGPLAVDAKNKRLVTVPVTAKLAPGVYKVNWSMKSEDGHTMSGGFGFTVK